MGIDKLDRKLAAVVAADVAGYSRLMGADEEGTHAAMKAHQRELIDPKVKEFGGRIVKTAGDGLLMEFPSVVDALRCCVEVQRGMKARNESVPLDRRIQFRVGVNMGDIIIDEGDVFGDGVNVAARLEAIAVPGGICVSQAVVDQVKQKLDVTFEDLGSRALKNIEEPVRTYGVVEAGGTTETEGVSSHQTDVLPHLSTRPSLAIMAFRNLNEDAAFDYIADGIGLGIQTLLVQLSGLFFINACSDQRYREGKATASEALRELPVRYALEGTVQKAGQRVRVTVQLTDLQNSVVIWAEHYDRDLEDVFALQDDITREVTTSLSSEVLGADFSRISMAELRGEGAWQYFLRGVSHLYKFTSVDNSKARQMFEKLYEMHPEKMFIPGYLALIYWLDATREWSDKPQQSLDMAAKWAEKAIVSDVGNNGLGHVVLGSLRLREGQFDEALDLCRRGVGFRMNCPFALGQLAAVQNYCGDAQGAVKTAREALSVRAIYSPVTVNVLAVAYRDSGQFEHSISAAREAARLDPELTDAYVTLCSDYVLTGDEKHARQTATEIIDKAPKFSVADYAQSQPYKETSTISQIAEALHAAGLPD